MLTSTQTMSRSDPSGNDRDAAATVCADKDVRGMADEFAALKGIMPYVARRLSACLLFIVLFR